VVVGGLLLAAPLGVEWVRERRNAPPPPSAIYEAVPWMLRGAGVVVIIAALVLGCVTAVNARSRAILERDQRMLAQAEADFVPPAPDRRGQLPVLGFLGSPQPDGTTVVSVFYAAPPDSGTKQLREFAKDGRAVDGRLACYADPAVHVNGDEVSFHAELVWAPETLADSKGDQSCSVARRYQIQEFVLGTLPDPRAVHTDGPTIDASGVVVNPVGPIQDVPRLADRPDLNLTKYTRYDRGEIPIIAYRDEGRLSELAFPVPPNAHVRPARSDGKASGGCEVLPTVSRADDSSVTMGLRLIWSNPDGVLKPEDDAKCRVGKAWADVLTARWDEIPSGITLLTNGPIVDPMGTVVRPAAPGNAVPKADASEAPVMGNVDAAAPSVAPPSSRPDVPTVNAAPSAPAVDAPTADVTVQGPNAAPITPHATPQAATPPTPTTQAAGPWTMPDVRGMSLRQATNTLHALTGNEELNIVASDVGDWHRDVTTPSMWDVCAQSPRAGQSLTSKKTVTFIVTRRGGKCK
jgi:hypothetical protein